MRAQAGPMRAHAGPMCAHVEPMWAHAWVFLSYCRPLVLLQAAYRPSARAGAGEFPDKDAQPPLLPPPGEQWA
jgi:hypothetical protein